MEPDPRDHEREDQAEFDANVQRIGKAVLQVFAGIGIFAAVLMAAVALINSGGATTVRVVGAASTSAVPMHVNAAQTVPTSAHIAIDHVMRGCHNLAVNGGAPNSPDATLRLAAGGRLYVQDNDVMPHKLYVRGGPAPQFTTPMMSHMGATSMVTFSKPGTYLLGTHPGEDYYKGVMTVGDDHVLKIKVIVS